MAKLDINDWSKLYILTINYKFEGSSINFDSIVSFIVWKNMQEYTKY